MLKVKEVLGAPSDPAEQSARTDYFLPRDIAETRTLFVRLLMGHPTADTPHLRFDARLRRLSGPSFGYCR
jgi:hypothetical protein